MIPKFVTKWHENKKAQTEKTSVLIIIDFKH